MHPHLRAALLQCATQTTLLVQASGAAWVAWRLCSCSAVLGSHPPLPLQLPLGPSLPRFLAWFHAVNLPFCMLNAARMASSRQPGAQTPNVLRCKPTKLAWD